MSDTVFLELKDEEGLDPDFLHERDPKTGEKKKHPNAGQAAPLVGIGINIPIPTMVKDDVAFTSARVGIQPGEAIDPDSPLKSRIIPGSRVVETRSPQVVEALLNTGLYRQIDQPKAVKPKGGQS